MGYDFPASPLVGQTFTPVGGGPSYVWNGYAWSTAGAGGIIVPAGQPILIASKTVTAAASVDFTSGIDGTYDEYELHFFNVRPASGSDSAISFRISQDGGATWKAGATDYYYGWAFINYVNTNSSFSGSTGSPHIQFAGIQLAGPYPVHGKIKFFNPSLAAVRKLFLLESAGIHNTLGLSSIYGVGQYGTDNNAFNGIRIFASTTGNISGTFNLYGINKTGTVAVASGLISAESRTTLDPQAVISGTQVIAFSNGNLTMTRINTGSVYHTAQGSPQRRGGAHYFEAQCFGTPGNLLIGAGQGGGYYGAGGYYPGQTAASVGFAGNGYCYAQGAGGVTGYPTWSANDWVGVWCHTARGEISVRNITANGNWNNVVGGNPGANPPTGMIGAYTSLQDRGVTPLACGYLVNDGWNMNFDGPFIGPVPAGATRWGA